VERLLGRCTERFEVVLGWHLWGFGPLIGVGRPAERVPQLGAAREYLDDETWQREIEKRISDARAVAVVLGRTNGLAWEIQALERLGATTRVLLIVPPVSRKELERRWTVFEQLAARAGWAIPAPAERSTMLVGTLDRYRTWTVITGRRRDEYEYEVALETCIAQLNRDGDA
jgi:hypothetical protein